MIIDNLNDALDVLVQAAQIAQKQGAYTIKESAYINASIEYLQELSGDNKVEEVVETEEGSDIPST